MEELTSWGVISGLAAALGLGTLVAAYFSETVRQLLPAPRKLVRSFRRRDLPPAEGKQFTVLIADLKRDADGSQTDHVAAALAPYHGLDLVRVGPGPEWDFGSRAQLVTQARRLIEAKNGDVLIFGEVAKADERLRLNFLGREAGAEGRPGSYLLEKAELPKGFGADFNAVLLASVAAQVAPATERAGSYLVDLLLPAAGKLEHLCDRMPSGLDSDQRGQLRHALGLATWVLGEQSGQGTWLERSIAAFQAALQELTRERVPLDWAITQNNLGNALLTLGEREGGTARLEAAVQAYRAALEELTRERVPLDWAITQNNLGNALQRLGKREGGTARLEEAVVAYRLALEERTRERVPLQWATTQNNLGNALSTLGERTRRADLLGEALAAVRGAHAAYAEAGMRQYDDDFTARIEKLEAAIAAMQDGRAAAVG